MQAATVSCCIFAMVSFFSTPAFSGSFYGEARIKNYQVGDDSNPPRRFREFNYSMSQRANLAAGAKHFLQGAQNALRALTNLETRCKAGMSHDDYVRALDEAKMGIDIFLKSDEAQHFHDLKSSIIKTVQFYNDVNTYFVLSEFESGICRQEGKEFDANHIEQKFDYLIGKAIDDASNQHATSYILVNHYQSISTP